MGAKAYKGMYSLRIHASHFRETASTDKVGRTFSSSVRTSGRRGTSTVVPVHWSGLAPGPCSWYLALTPLGYVQCLCPTPGDSREFLLQP